MVECFLWLLRPLAGPTKDVWAIAETGRPYGAPPPPSLLEILRLAEGALVSVLRPKGAIHE